MTNPLDVRVAAVIVTYNRIALLQECVAAVRAQTRPLDEIIVVNNDSTDGTQTWLEEQRDLTVIHQPNTGSSGGQYTGFKTAYEHGHDWIWCMDDDTVPTPTALSVLVHFASERSNENLGFLCSRVLWTNGRLHPRNRPRTFDKEWRFQQLADDLLEHGNVQIEISSFVSCLTKRTAVDAVGFPDRRFFIWWDDVEYQYRMRSFSNYHVADSVVVHKDKPILGSLFPRTDAEVFKAWYGLRNMFYFLRGKGDPYLLRIAGSFFKQSLLRLFSGDANLRIMYWTWLAMFRGYTGNMSPFSHIHR